MGNESAESAKNLNPLFGKKIKYGKGPQGSSTSFAFLRPLGLGRTPQASVTTAGEEQVAGLSFSPTVIYNGTTNYANGAEFGVLVNPTTSLPEPSAGTNWFAIRNVAGSNSCIEIDIVYQRSAGDTNTSMTLVINDTCSGVQKSFPMNSTFFSMYGIPGLASAVEHPQNPNVNTPGSVGLLIYALLGYNGPVWSVLLAEDPSSSSSPTVLDDFWDSPDIASAYSNAESYLDINSFAVGACPALPTQGGGVYFSDNAQNGLTDADFVGGEINGYPNNYEYGGVPESIISPTNIQNTSATPDCFQSTPDINPYYAFYPYNLGSEWSLSTQYNLPSPSPMPSPSAAPSSAPSPSPSPSPSPFGSRYISVTINTAALNASPGQTLTFPCALTIQSGDSVDKYYVVSDWGAGTFTGGSGSFPIFNSPQASDLSWSLDSSTTYTAFANKGASGQTTYVVDPPLPATHCMNLKLVVPAGEPPGTYSASIEFALYGHNSLETLEGETTKTVSVVVSS